MTKTSTTFIGVKRIVIEVNRNLTVEQLERLDFTLRALGLVKNTKVTLHKQQPRKPRSANQSKTARPPAAATPASTAENKIP